jgi:hypothetical protein
MEVVVPFRGLVMAVAVINLLLLPLLMAVVAAAGGGDDGKVAPPPIVTMPSDERKQNYIDKVKRLSRMHTKERPMRKLVKMVEEEDDDENNNSGTHPVTIDPHIRARNILQVLQQHQQEHDVLDWEFGKLVGQQQRQDILTNEDIDTYLSSKQKALQTLIRVGLYHGRTIIFSKHIIIIIIIPVSTRWHGGIIIVIIPVSTRWHGDD